MKEILKDLSIYFIKGFCLVFIVIPLIAITMPIWIFILIGLMWDDEIDNYNVEDYE